MDVVWLTASYLHLDNLPQKSKARVLILPVFQAFLEHGVPENPEMVVALMQKVSLSYYSCLLLSSITLQTPFYFILFFSCSACINVYQEYGHINNIPRHYICLNLNLMFLVWSSLQKAQKLEVRTGLNTCSWNYHYQQHKYLGVTPP